MPTNTDLIPSPRSLSERLELANRLYRGGKTWKAINRGLRSDYLPEPTPEVGFCVHDMVMNPASAASWRVRP